MLVLNVHASHTKQAHLLVILLHFVCVCVYVYVHTVACKVNERSAMCCHMWNYTSVNIFHRLISLLCKPVVAFYFSGADWDGSLSSMGTPATIYCSVV